MSAMPQVLPLVADLPLPDADARDLASLRTGETATVAGLDPEKPDAVAKLLALGVVPGMEITLESTGPAVVFRLGHARFAVDAELARVVLVQRDQSAGRVAR